MPGTLFLLFRLLQLKKIDEDDAEGMLADRIRTVPGLENSAEGKRKAGKMPKTLIDRIP